MSRIDKLLVRLRLKPKDFTWDEAVTLLGHHGYELLNNKGSRRKFFHSGTQKVVIIHEPHPQNILKPYVVADLIEALCDV